MGIWMEDFIATHMLPFKQWLKDPAKSVYMASAIPETNEQDRRTYADLDPHGKLFKEHPGQRFRHKMELTKFFLDNASRNKYEADHTDLEEHDLYPESDLGMVWTKGKLSIPRAKTLAFQNLPSPNTPKKAKSVICALSYYRKFVMLIKN